MSLINNINITYSGYNTNKYSFNRIQTKPYLHKNDYCDCFVKFNSTSFKGDASPIVKEFIKDIDYNELSKNLIKNNIWTNGMDFIGFNKKNKYLSGTSVGIFNFEKNDPDIKKLSLENFIKVMKEVKDYHLKKQPTERKRYTNNFTNLKKYIEDNSKK